MAIKTKDGRYKCLFCDVVMARAIDVEKHQTEVHDYLLVPMTREELTKLVMFIMTKDDELLTEKLYKRLRNYSKYRIKAPVIEE